MCPNVLQKILKTNIWPLFSSKPDSIFAILAMPTFPCVVGVPRCSLRVCQWVKLVEEIYRRQLFLNPTIDQFKNSTTRFMLLWLTALKFEDINDYETSFPFLFQSFLFFYQCDHFNRNWNHQFKSMHQMGS